MSYNGWSNYETWAVNLWLENEPSDYAHVLAMVDEARETGREGHHCWTPEEHTRFALADALKGYVTDEYGPVADVLAQASLAADLLGAALEEVDWTEIAENLLAE